MIKNSKFIQHRFFSFVILLTLLLIHNPVSCAPSQLKLLDNLSADKYQSDTPGSYTMNFDDANAKEYIKVVLGNILNVNYSIHADLNFPINIQTSVPMNKRQLVLSLVATLEAHGIIMEDGDDGIIHIRRQPSNIERLIETAMKHHLVFMGFGLFLLVFLVSHAIYLIKPLWIIRINAVLSSCEIGLPGNLANIQLPLRHILIIGFYEHSNRVLDAWVRKYRTVAQQHFSKFPTVNSRSVRIPVPVSVDDKPPILLDSSNLAPLCSKSRWCLFLHGEGGSGKTALACAMGLWSLSEDDRFTRHYMIPILIEPDLQGDDSLDADALITLIQGSLEALIGQVLTMSKEFVLILLRRQRLFVIIDGLSEMDCIAESSLALASPDFSIAALAITSRTAQILGGVPKNTLMIPQINGDRLSSFLDGYLTKLGTRSLMDDETFFDACRTLSKLVGKRSITVLLAKMFAELITSNRENNTTITFNSVPELMLDYLNELNRRSQEKYSDQSVQFAAEMISFKCLERNLYPEPAPLDEVKKILESHNLTSLLEHLEINLKLIQIQGVQRDHVRFSLDPLAEYLAAIYLIRETAHTNEDNFDSVSKIQKKLADTHGSGGFTMAVLDACRSDLFGSDERPNICSLLFAEFDGTVESNDK